GDAGVPLGMRLRRSGTGVGARLRRRGAARTSRGPAVLGDPTPDPDVLVGPMLDPGVLGGPMLELPGRHHMLFAGSLDDVGALAEGAASCPGSSSPGTGSAPGQPPWCRPMSGRRATFHHWAVGCTTVPTLAATSTHRTGSFPRPLARCSTRA
ncbi:MAG: hypothetical protein J0I40_02770, partial [Cellulomonas sp.]|nr:hypothetical protein [Cellulomonas sp.]